MSNVFLACPTHDGRIDFRTARSLYQTASKQHAMMISVNQGSLLAHNCNQLWCTALNNKKQHNLHWFAMLHSDVIPEPYWLDKLIDIAEYYGTDMLSAIVPIKDDRGLTSTAISDGDAVFDIKTRLTLKQIWEQGMPETFDIGSLPAHIVKKLNIDVEHDHLLVNTGCTVIRMSHEFDFDPSLKNIQQAEVPEFDISDIIYYDREHNCFSARVQSEDWYFSQRLSMMGAVVMATRGVQVYHAGTKYFNSHEVWGSELDPHFEAKQPKAQPRKKVFLDCGFHHGEGLKKFIKMLSINDTWEVHCFEPNHSCYANERLQQIYPNGTMHSSAVWIKEGTIEFCRENWQESNSGSPVSENALDGWASCVKDVNSTHPGLQESVPVPCMDFSNFLELFRDCDVYCKMDIEGAEFAVLRKVLADGNAGIIKKLWVEFHRYLPGENRATIRALMDQLQEHTEVEVWH